ncbi:Arm DNA-binding domain-containing protein [Pasteurella sp. PK-2025]|uniref:Arm DNA-binding domain-containing protein n=1 Tax=unclassified Pasteurella TaxID=2621516 RepID=UPI003C7753C9
MGEKKQNPRGVTIRRHKNSETINITFTYKGVRCREPLNIPVTQSNINYASRLLGEIKNKIERDLFNYADYFPSSSKLRFFGKVIEGVTIKSYLDEYIKTSELRKLSPSTIDGYKKVINSISHFHKIAVSQLTPAMVKNWIKQQNTTTKTIRNKLSVLRSALDEAVTDGVISINPISLITIDRYREKGTTDSSSPGYEVDPFTPEEISLILKNCQYQQWKNLFQFALRTGLRSSELCALRWIDIDFDKKSAHIQTAKVVGVIKGTKTKAGNRDIDLDSIAIVTLLNQKEFTYSYGDFVFYDPKAKRPWDGANAIRKKAWLPTLKKANIRYRNPYQTRHTFATMHISQGANLFWLSQQMGHKGPEMLFRKYGSYLKEYDGKTSKEP